MSLVLVTGGAGFIGSHLAWGLVERGDEVRILDDLSTGLQQNLTSLDSDFQMEDIRDQGAVDQAMQDVQTVFHLAALTSVPESVEVPQRCYEVNLIGSLNVLWAAHRAGVRRVVLASSCAVYGEIPPPMREDAVAQPLSPYAASKLAMEEAARLFYETHGLETICLRFFNVYGPRQAPDSEYAAVIPKFIQVMMQGGRPVIFGDGSQTRDFVHVSDVVRAMLLAGEREATVGKVVNVGSGQSISILALAEALRMQFPGGAEPSFSSPRQGDLAHSAADMDRADQTLGYRPQVALEQGLRSTIEWFEALNNEEL